MTSASGQSATRLASTSRGAIRGADSKHVHGIAKRTGFAFYTYTLAVGWDVKEERVHVEQWEILLWDSLLCHAGSPAKASATPSGRTFYRARDSEAMCPTT